MQGELVIARVAGHPSEGVKAALYGAGEMGSEGLIVWFHGGGWVKGSIEEDDWFCEKLASETGVKVLSVSYSLAPQYPFPRALEDCEEAFEWIRQNAFELEANPGLIGIGGESAGGNIAAGGAGWLLDRRGWSLAMQILICPALIGMRTSGYESGRRYASGFGNDEIDRQTFWDAYVPREADRVSQYAAPLLRSSYEGLPNAVIVTAEFDPIRDEAEEYGRRLRGAGIDSSIRRVSGARHGPFRKEEAWSVPVQDAFSWMCNEISSRLGVVK